MIEGNLFSPLFQSLPFSSKTENETLSFYSVVVFGREKARRDEGDNRHFFFFFFFRLVL